jgi:hypothetical protein
MTITTLFSQQLNNEVFLYGTALEEIICGEAKTQRKK